MLPISSLKYEYQKFRDVRPPVISQLSASQKSTILANLPCMILAGANNHQTRLYAKLDKKFLALFSWKQDNRTRANSRQLVIHTLAIA